MLFVQSIHSEWIKTRRTAGSWLTIIGGFFIPTINFIAALVNGETLNDRGLGAWQWHFMEEWMQMAAFLLPMGVILASTLITQIEFKNNTWKQLMTTPQSLAQVFFSKFSVILLMTFKFFLFFNIGILLSGILPSLILDGKMPQDSIPVSIFLKQNALIFVTCLPILAIQYLISLQSKNFMVPIGIGLLMLIGTMIGIGGQWEHIYISPYSYCTLKVVPIDLKINLYSGALIQFTVIMSISYYLFITKKEKG